MPSKYASAKNSISQCDRCGFRFKLTQLKRLVIKTKNVNILVCPECWEPDQPQLSLGLYPVNDPQAVRNPRPDSPSYYQAGLNGLQTIFGVNLLSFGLLVFFLGKLFTGAMVAWPVHMLVSLVAILIITVIRKLMAVASGNIEESYMRRQYRRRY